MKNWRISKLPVKEYQYANVFSSFDYQMKSVGDAIAHCQTRRISTLSRRKERKRKQEKERKRGKIAVVMFAISTRMIVMITMLLSMNLKVLLLSLVSFPDSNMRRVIKARRIMTDNNSCRLCISNQLQIFIQDVMNPKHTHTKANLSTSSAINPGINFALSLDYRQRKNKEKKQQLLT